MLLIVRSFIPELDARVQRYMRSLRSDDIEVFFLGWQRGSVPGNEGEDALFYQGSRTLGGGLRNIPALFGWAIFVFAQLWRRRGSIEAVQAIDLDSALPALLFCKLTGTPFVLDLYDQYSSSRNITGLPGKALDRLEKGVARWADLIIVPTAQRLDQHGIADFSSKTLILENVTDTEIPYREAEIPGEILTIGYFGVLEPMHRGLENLLDLARRHKQVHLVVAGYGPLEEVLHQASETHGNIRFLGPLGQRDGLMAMRDCDVVAGLYYLSNANHRYAAPNKYSEHLMLGRPRLTTRGTPPGRLVEQHGTGWAIEDGTDAMEMWLAGLVRDDVQRYGRAARILWGQSYSSYQHVHYAGLYAASLRALMNRGNR